MEFVSRFADNPIITPADVKPSTEGLEVICAFNPAAVMHHESYLLLLRVAERPIQEPGYVSVPVVDDTSPNGLTIQRFRTDDPDLDFKDPRLFTYRGKTYLTSLSHLRLARSGDGYHFSVDDQPTVWPQGPYENFGIEDARITLIDGKYLINYTAVSSEAGVCPSLAITTDWESFDRLGVILPCANKDVCIFPEQFDGKYVMRHRPIPGSLTSPSMWTAESSDLIHWGGHTHLMSPRYGMWDAERVGAGAPPIRTDRGWLEFYHGCDDRTIYKVAPLLTDLEDPHRILVRGEPMLEPTASYELDGFLGRVVFHNGLIQKPDGTALLYYGAADSVTCGCQVNVNEVVQSLTG